MKKTLLYLTLAMMAMTSCHKESEDQNSSTAPGDNSSITSDSSSRNENRNQSPTYDANSANNSFSGQKENNGAQGNTNRKTTVDHSTRDFNGRSKYDSTKMNSGVAGQQGGGAGVGNGGSINGADTIKTIR